MTTLLDRVVAAVTPRGGPEAGVSGAFAVQSASLPSRITNVLKGAAAHPHAGRPGKVGGSAPGHSTPIPAFSSRRVDELRTDKLAWVGAGHGQDGARAIIQKYYKAHAYAGQVTPGHLLVPMPSTGGNNILPDALMRSASASGRMLLPCLLYTSDAADE